MKYKIFTKYINEVKDYLLTTIIQDLGYYLIQIKHLKVDLLY